MSHEALQSNLRGRKSGAQALEERENNLFVLLTVGMDATVVIPAQKHRRNDAIDDRPSLWTNWGVCSPKKPVVKKIEEKVDYNEDFPL
ncbi:MAG TPA: hypothetical protein VF343_02070 [Syntrophales bacterium]